MSERAVLLLASLQKRLADEGNLCINIEDAELLCQLEPRHNLDLLALTRLASAVEKTSRDVFTCAIVNAKSGCCQENCAFCAQSGHYKTDVPAYPLLPGTELLKRALAAQEAGLDRFGIVTSGSRLSEKEFSSLLASIAMIKERVSIALCASLGQIDQGRAERLRLAGLIRYHHNLETSASFFPRICGTHDYAEDLATVRAAKAAGLQTCCGGIFGLGEGWPERIELSATLAELEVDCIPFNFLNPIAGTPLQNQPPLKPQEALRIIAIMRLMHPRRDIVICGGRPQTLCAWQNLIFMAGANGLMSGDYLTMPGCRPTDDKHMIEEMGLRP